MSFKKPISVLVAFSMALAMLAGCSKEVEEPVVETEPSITYPPLSEVVAETQPVSLDGEPPITEDEAVEIALKGYNALKSNSIKELIKYTNIDLYYYLSTGKWATEDELIEIWKNANSSKTNKYGIMNNIKYMQAEVFTIEELEDYGKTIDVLEVIGGLNIDYDITAAYKVKLFLDDTYTETVTSINEEGETITEEIHPDITSDNAPYFVVVKGNGKWRMDICVSFFRDMMNNFNKLDGDDLGVLVDDILPEAVTAESETAPVTGTTTAAETDESSDPSATVTLTPEQQSDYEEWLKQRQETVNSEQEGEETSVEATEEGTTAESSETTQPTVTFAPVADPAPVTSETVSNTDSQTETAITLSPEEMKEFEEWRQQKENNKEGT